MLACFCTIHNHGFEMLFSFSAIIQHAPSPPLGFGILKAGLNKSVLLSVYASSSVRNSDESLSYGTYQNYLWYFVISFYLLDIVSDTFMYNDININMALVQAC